MDRIEVGAQVLTVKTANPSTDWQGGTRDGCTYGVLGTVFRVSDHGLRYLVVHKEVRAWYDPDELVEIDDIEAFLREAVEARMRANKEMRGYEEGLYKAASRDYAKGRWAAAGDLLIYMNIARSNSPGGSDEEA